MNYLSGFHKIDFHVLCEILSYVTLPDDIFLSPTSITYILTFRQIYEKAMNLIQNGKKLKSCINSFLHSTQQLNWIISMGALPSHQVIYRHASITGNITIIKQFKQDFLSLAYIQEKLCPLTIQHNHFHVLQYLFQNSGNVMLRSMTYIIDKIIYYGNLHFLECFHQYIQHYGNKNHQIQFYDEIFYKSLRYEKIHIANWLSQLPIINNHSNEYDYIDHIARECAHQGHIQSLKWLIEKKEYVINSEIMTSAIIMNHCDMVKWLYQLNPNIITNLPVYKFAVTQKHGPNFDILRWYRTLDIPITQLDHYYLSRAHSMGYNEN